MKQDSESTETTSRRHFTKAVVTAAVAAPIAASLVSCAKEPPVATPPAPTPSPGETPDKGHGRPRPDDGSTITVGGGGGKDAKDRMPIWCEFYNHENYPEPEPQSGPKSKKFVHKDGWRLASLKINGIDLTSALPTDPDPQKGTCEIKVECPGSDNDIFFYSHPLAVEFHTGKWKQNGDPKRHTSTNNDRYISKVGIKIKRLNKPDAYFEWPFSKNDVVELKVSGAA